MLEVRVESNFSIRPQGEYQKALDLYIRTTYRLAAKAFVEAAVPTIPTDTGMARGLFLDLAREVRASISIPVLTKGRLWYGDRFYKAEKTPELGSKFSEYSFEKRTFTLSTDLIYFIANQGKSHTSPSSPWKSMDAGHAAFVEVIADRFNAFPDIFKERG